MRTYEDQVLTNGSLAAAVSTPSINAGSYWGGSIACTVTASSSAVGVLTLQGSVDGVNFAAIQYGTPGTQVPYTIAVSGDGLYQFDIPATGMRNLLVSYARTGGSGTLNVSVFMKGY